MSETQTIRENSFLSTALPPTNLEVIARDTTAEALNPMTAPKALGAVAVYNSLIAAQAAVSGDGKAEESRNKSNGYELQSIRDVLASTGDKDKARIGNVLLGENPPEWLMASFGGPTAQPLDIIKAITAKREDGEPSVSNETLGNLFEWHNHVQGKRQEQFEAEVIGPMRSVFAERLGAAVEKGWLPADTLDDKRRRLIAETPVYIDDGVGFDRIFSSLGGGAMAYSSLGIANPHIVFAERHATKSTPMVEETFTHEMVHIVTGRSPDETSIFNFSTDPNELAGSYGLERLGGEGNIGKGLNEAMTEHMAQALISGDIEKIRPWKGAYKAERYVLKALCNRGKIKISPIEFAQAMFAGVIENRSLRSFNDESGEEPAIMKLKALLTEAFPDKDIVEFMKEKLAEPKMFGQISVGGAMKFVHKL